MRASGASIVSSRYSHDEMSDHEPEGSTYTASFAPSDILGQTHSTFGLGEDISTSFEPHRQQYDYSRSLEFEESLPASLRHSVADDPLARRARLEQPVMQQQESPPTRVSAQSPGTLPGFCNSFPTLWLIILCIMAAGPAVAGSNLAVHGAVEGQAGCCMLLFLQFA